MVAFGKKLKERQLLEWQGFYINYKLMKKKVKQYAQQIENGALDRRHVLKDFSRMLDIEIEKIVLFLLEQQGTLATRISKLNEQHEALQQEPDIAQISDLREAYRAVGQDLLKLLFFIEVNAIGLRKILKKFDKRFGYRFTDYYVKTRANHPYSQLQQVCKHVGIGAVAGAISRNLGDLQDRQGSYLSIYDQPALPLQDPVIDAIKAAVDRLSYSTNFLNFLAQHALIMQEELPTPTEGQVDDQRYSFVSLLLNLVNTFLYMVNTYIIVPTADNYSTSLGAAATVCGVVIGAMAVAQVFSSVYFSAWSNKSYYKPLVFSSIVLFAGNLMYAMAYDFDSITVLILGRLLCGFGSARAVNRRYISDCVPLRIRMQASAGFVSASALGMACGPALAGLLQTKFKIYKISFNEDTLPGWVMAVAWLFYLVWLCISFKEPSRDIEETQAPENSTNGNGAVEHDTLEKGLNQPLLIASSEEKEEDEDGEDLDASEEAPDESRRAVTSIGSAYRLLTPSVKVHDLLKDVDPEFIKQFVPRTDLPFLSGFPVTPNAHRVTEFMNSQIFDDLTRALKKLPDFRGKSNELGSYVMDCLKVSKLGPGNSSNKESVFTEQIKIKDTATQSAGLRWIKDVVLGKRSSHCFRMVVTGNPNLKLSEIGIPCYVAEKLLVPENLNTWNWEKLSACCDLRILEKGGVYVRRKGEMVLIRSTDDLRIEDTIHRPLNDGDLLLINRPPSIHHHSLVALSVKVLPITSVVSINPLCCSPFHGDFDGDCFHGYVPQSIDARVELSELVGLNRQLINGQSGRNLLSLSQDSLIAVHLLMEDGVFLNHFQMQQLQMFSDHELPSPAIIKASSLDTCLWTGQQLFSMLLPKNFNFEFPKNGVCIRDGEVMSSSEGADWLRAGGNIFQSMVECFPENVLDFLASAQEALCEWLTATGLSVSLSDLYFSSDSYSRSNMIDDMLFGLREAEQTCNFKQLMVDSSRDFLAGSDEDSPNTMMSGAEYLCFEKQKSAVLSQASVDAFKQVFRDIQSLVFKHASKDNSLMAMFKSGSKGNLLRMVQHSMCLGLQHSLVPLSFGMPHELSCAAWNKKKAQDTLESSRTFIPYAVVQNSFLSGLNPLECFVHSVTNRDSSFSDNAELPGTLNRKLMFFMRDLYTAYDGTVRNTYGNQLVQFSYRDGSFDENDHSLDEMVGQPAGTLSASAISEAAYSALDQPISVLQSSPLLNLKSVLECGFKKRGPRTMLLFLSKQLGKRRHGFEYGALEIKTHLERLFFSEIVSTFMIIFSPRTSQRHVSPWVCHFHVCKEIVKSRRLKVHSIVEALYKKLNSTRTESRTILPNFHITSKDCCDDDMQKEDNDTFCITVEIIESSKNSSLPLESVRDLVIPFFLGTVIKGFAEIKKVDILWKDLPNQPKIRFGPSSGELYLRVSMSGDCGQTGYWSALMNNCLPVMEMIDWTRSQPENIKDFCSAYGIGSGWKYFLNGLDSATSDTGKSILPQHLLLLANCLSITGEFVGLNAKGLARQKEQASVSSPFTLAFFSTPGQTFIKAAKSQIVDDLQGSVDALAWGKVPPTGTGGQFDIIYSGKGRELANPANIYNELGSEEYKQNVKIGVPWKHKPEKDCAKFGYSNGGSAKWSDKFSNISKPFLRKFWTWNDIQKLRQAMGSMLHKYPIDQRLSDGDKSTVMKALYFHPQRDEKIGSGAANIKVGYHSKYQDARCFILERADGTDEDFSYRKCIHRAMEIIDPIRAKSYQSKWLQHVA